MGTMYAPTSYKSNSALSALFDSLNISVPQPIAKWSYVNNRFRKFLLNIEPTETQHQDVRTKANGILNCLNNNYWNGQLADG